MSSGSGQKRRGRRKEGSDEAGRLKKLETIAEEKPRVMAAGVVWTSDHEHYAGNLQPGERIVSDVHIGEDYGGAQAWALRDRPARDDEDLGDVYQGGELVGKVERVEGSLVVYRELVGQLNQRKRESLIVAFPYRRGIFMNI